ncbi:cuticle protein 19-like [Sitophilus oryzae]|uniref:Cuticle protein 19-like n=1 Tax=Sitophilus oryzae TaxID=7048 RepID=A0A6J2XW30_SITOR|nr:cuticle protein 19-like [Sitophilus oryzae]
MNKLFALTVLAFLGTIHGYIVQQDDASYENYEYNDDSGESDDASSEENAENENGGQGRFGQLNSYHGAQQKVAPYRSAQYNHAQPAAYHAGHHGGHGKPQKTHEAHKKGYGGHHHHHHTPHYHFSYGVHDPHTKDHKSHQEYRHKDKVVGRYTVEEPDGTHRIVEYTADKHNGFQAVVKRIGHAKHPGHKGHGHSFFGTTHWGYGSGR